MSTQPDLFEEEPVESPAPKRDNVYPVEESRPMTAECVECGQPVRAVNMAAEPAEGELLPFSRLEAWAGSALYCTACFEALP